MTKKKMFQCTRMRTHTKTLAESQVILKKSLHSAHTFEFITLVSTKVRFNCSFHSFMRYAINEKLLTIQFPCLLRRQLLNSFDGLDK